MNDCLRPASLQDLPMSYFTGTYTQWNTRYDAMHRLYHAEWAKRGYRRAP